MIQKLLHSESVVLIGLQALCQEKGTLDSDLLFEHHCVVSFVDFVDEVSHLVGVEGGATHKHLVGHDAYGPHVDLVAVLVFLQKLGR